jgi:hypothetical protein
MMEFPLTNPGEAIADVLDDLECIFSVRHDYDESPSVDVRALYAEICANGTGKNEFAESADNTGDKARMDAYRDFYLRVSLSHCAVAVELCRNGRDADAWGRAMKAKRFAGMVAGVSIGLQLGLQSFVGKESVQKRWGPNQELRAFAVRRYEEECLIRPFTQCSANNMAKLLESEVRKERDRLGVKVKDEEMSRWISDTIRKSPGYKSRKSTAK